MTTTPAKPAPLPLWEKCASLLWRVPAPGGWLYRTTDDATGTPALAFVPDPARVDQLEAARAVVSKFAADLELGQSTKLLAQELRNRWAAEFPGVQVP